MNTTFTNGTGSKKRRALDFLMAGKGLTSNEARSRFGIQNFRATVSDIKDQVMPKCLFLLLGLNAHELYYS